MSGLPDRPSRLPRLLIVDDSAPICRAYARYFYDHADVVTTTDPLVGAVKLAYETFDIALIDQKMEPLNGLAVAHYVSRKCAELGRDCPKMVLYSGWTLTKTEHLLAKVSGITRVIDKADSAEALRRIVDEVAGSRFASP